MAEERSALSVAAQSINFVGANVAAAALFRGPSGFIAPKALFALWLLFPFALVSAMVAASRRSTAMVVALLAASVFGLVMYLDPLLASSPRERSHADLAFLLVPPWQMFCFACAVALGFIIDLRRERRNRRSAASQLPDAALEAIPGWVGYALGTFTSILVAFNTWFLLATRDLPFWKHLASGTWRVHSFAAFPSLESPVSLLLSFTALLFLDILPVLIVATPAVGLVASICFLIGWPLARGRWSRRLAVPWALALSAGLFGWPAACGCIAVNGYAKNGGMVR